MARPTIHAEGWSRVIPPLLASLALAGLLTAVAVSFAADTPTDAYLRFWGSTRGWQALGRTLHLATLAALIAVPLGYGVVAAAAKCGPGWTLAAVVASCSAMLVPASLVATAWTIVAAPTHPIGAAVARWWPSFDLYSLPAAAVILALRYFGLAAAVVWAERLRHADSAPVERAFGIPAPTRWIHLHLRPALPAMAGGAAMVMLFTMNDHILPGMLLISTVGTQVMIEYVARMDPAGAAALAAPMAAVGAALLWIAHRLIRPAAWPTEQVPAPAPATGRAWRVGGAVVSTAILAVALAVPICVLAERAGSPAALAEAFAAGRREVLATLTLAAVAAALCTLAAAVLAGYWLRCRRTGKRTATVAVLLNLAAPASLLAIGTIALVWRAGLTWLDQTIWPLALACVARFLPVGALVLFVLWRNESPVADQAAWAHGVGFWRRTWRLTWPRRRLSLLAAAMLCGVLVATELEMSVMLAPPGGGTLALRLYTLMHTAPDRVVSALTLCLLAMAAAGATVLAGAIAFASRRRRRVSGTWMAHGPTDW